MNGEFKNMIDLFEEDYLDEDEMNLHQSCPYCGKHYDEIDYEYQICHVCGFDAENDSLDKD